MKRATTLATRDTLFKLSGFLGNDDQLLKHKVGVSHLKTDSNTVGYTSAYDAKNSTQTIN